jgi:transcriptional regulator with XRE-family HTH domain
MREEQRELARRRLDKELKYYRIAARKENPTQALLREVRQALGVRVEEIAKEMQVSRSVVFRLEASEKRGRIALSSMARLAGAMGCRVVYAVIPQGGETLEEMADRRKWSKILEVDAE